MSYIPGYPNARVVNGSDYLTIPALGTYLPSNTSAVNATSNTTNITVPNGDTIYGLPGSIVRMTSGVSSGQQKILSAFATGVNGTFFFDGQGNFNVTSGDTYTITCNSSYFDTPVNSSQLVMFRSSLIRAATTDWQTNFRDAFVRVTTGVAAGQVFQIKYYNNTTYVATLYNPIGILPAQGDTWVLVGASIACTGTGAGTITVANTPTPNAMIAKCFPANTQVILLSNGSSGTAYGQVVNLTSSTGFTTLNVSATLGTTGNFWIRMFAGVVPTLTGAKQVFDVSSYLISKLRLYIPFNDTTVFSFYRAKMVDIKNSSSNTTTLALNSAYVLGTPVSISTTEVVLADNIITIGQAYWIENYNTTAVAGVQFTAEYFR